MVGTITRRTLARLTVLLATAGSMLLGWVTAGFDIDHGGESSGRDEEVPDAEATTLPRPWTVEGTKRVAAAIADRRSRRTYGADPLSGGELGKLLWAAQGTTERRIGRQDFRAAPSAGATYPIELYVVVGDQGVEGLQPGIYHYVDGDHALNLVETGDRLTTLQNIALDQDWVDAAPLAIVVTAIDERTTRRYGPRGRRRYVPMEAGHVGENIYLQAESLGLATVAVGAFRDGDLRDLLGITEAVRPLAIYPVGTRP